MRRGKNKADEGRLMRRTKSVLYERQSHMFFIKTEKTNPDQATFWGGKNPPKNYTNFTSLCKSENLSKKENFSKILLTNAFSCVKIMSVSNKAELCNGSTADSDSVCWGSNPYIPARKKHLRKQVLFSTKFALAGK